METVNKEKDRRRAEDSGTVGSRRRRYVTRACDYCKKQKLKCNGRQPCTRCSSLGSPCKYDSAYLRIRRTASATERKSRSLASPKIQAPPISAGSSHQPLVNHESVISPPLTSCSTWETQDDVEDPSVHTFLQNVYGRLSTMGKTIPRSLFKSTEESLGKASDGGFTVLPDRSTMLEYLQCFFDHANVTYRYVPRVEIEELLDRLYDQEEAVYRDDAAIAMLFMVAGVGCAWSSSWHNESLEKFKTQAVRLFQAGKSRLDKLNAVFPPSLNELRARTAASQLLLATGYFNMAWVNHGVTVRLAQIVGLQKAQKDQDDEIRHARETLFWGLFMLDRYLSIVSGRPMAINEEDVTISLPGSMPASCVAGWGKAESKLVAGATCHASLSRIIGRIVRKLYSAEKCSYETRTALVEELEAEIKVWVAQTPQFFQAREDDGQSDDHEFYDIPWTLLRQQRTIRGAFFFTNMLLYRGYVLDVFRQTPESSNPQATHYISRCLGFALRLARYAGEVGLDPTYNAAFWTTSHFAFCSIAVLVVYLTIFPNTSDKKEIETVLQAALEGHKKLDQSRDFRAQRFLEESRDIANAVQQPSSTHEVAVLPSQMERGATLPNETTREMMPIYSNQAPMDGGQDLTGRQFLSHLTDYDSSNFNIWQAYSSEFDNNFDMVMNLGFDASAYDLFNAQNESF